jgi:IS30 family transposase
MEKNYHHLTREQRDVIYRLHQECKSQNQISRQIGVHRSTVLREIKRNSNAHVGYLPDDAHGSAHKRRYRPSTKICRSSELQALIAQYLSQGWSPEVITGRLKLEKAQHRISHESIYKWIYKEGRLLKLHVYLI